MNRLFAFTTISVLALLVWGSILFVSYSKPKTKPVDPFNLRESTLTFSTQPISNSKCIEGSKLDLWHDDEYYLHANEKFPLTKSEQEYYGRGILLNGLHPYPTLKSMMECQNLTSDIESLTILSSDELKSKFFTSSLIKSFEPLSNSPDKKLFINDYHQDKSLYTIDSSQQNQHQKGQLLIQSKVSTLMVHALFSHQLPLYEDLAKYPIVSTKSKDKYCSIGNIANCKRGHFCAICEESKVPKSESKSFYSNPWCFKSNFDYSILSIQDGIVDNGVSHDLVPGPVFDKNGNIVLMSTPHSLRINTNAPLHYEPQFAHIGISYYPSAAGHFPIEILPRVVFLSYFLPLHIPILLNDVKKNREIIKLFQESGIIHPKRKFVWGADRHYYMGKRVYFLHSKDDYASLTPDVVMRMASNLYSKVYSKRLNLNPMLKLMKRKEYVLVVDRSDVGNRMIINQGELIQSLQEFLNPLDIDVIPVKLSQWKSFLDISLAFYGAIAVVAPHGAGLGNLNAVNRDKIKFIMEMGWKDGWPADFWCGSRSIGVKYISVICDSMDFNVDTSEVVEHFKREFKDYKK